MLRALLTVLAYAAFAGAQQASTTPAQSAAGSWSGFQIQSADGQSRLQVGAEIMNDWAFFFGGDKTLPDRLQDAPDGTEFREAILGVSGQLYGRLKYKAAYGFTGGQLLFKDVFLSMDHLPAAGTLRLGQFREPFSIEEVTSTSSVTFMERSLINPFAPSRNVGFALNNAVLDQRATWAAGVFKRSSSGGSASGDGNYDVAGRVTFAPIYGDGGRRIVHLGVSGVLRRQGIPTVALKVLPESHLAPAWISASIPADQNNVDAEAAVVAGPVSLQGEYLRSMAKGDKTFTGFYVFASWFLTGESRPYGRAVGVFGQVKPRANFGEAGQGALEVAARYSQIDMTDAVAAGGKMRDVTLGLTWYLYPQARVMANYILSDLVGVGTAHTVETRFQVAF